MALNYVWLAFFLISFVVAIFKTLILHDATVFGEVMNSLMASTKTGAEISLGLIGVMSFWLGIMRIGEKAGVINVFARLVNPFYSKLFPQVPKGDPAMGSMVMNFSATMLGLDNAATPFGLKAMKQLQELNPSHDTASNAEIALLVLNSAGVVIIPTSVIALRLAAGASNPADILVPTLLSTFIAFIVGIFVIALFQRINIFKIPVLIFLAGFMVIMAALFYWVQSLPPKDIAPKTASLGGIIIFGIIVLFIVAGLVKKIVVYETFIEGAKEGFQTAVNIIPYLVGMLAAISVFRATGCMDYVVNGIAALFAALGMNTDFVPALPVMFMKPLSGGGARALMVDTMKTYKPDSFVGYLVSILQGTTETTFYVISVYFGSINIRNTRYALVAGLIADFAGMIAAVFLAYFFFRY
ncbi:Spore maturation protein SpmA [Chitinophaga costaii]|uniref:Spore maturation protein SpmA n=1 Tax=Chitinophaga costaii TaxID=1335309 RepID=A0A1C4FI53_9BACT|nr:nucleoside recognition domain-containing protein [Chitinophaga costaii]PUZ20293.1 hypothetical protein DCM91_19175 [Chitinophaga costaii]SCC55532.1 Spore maturation protein SpmA [Chitinophaga costaii]